MNFAKIGYPADEWESDFSFKELETTKGKYDIFSFWQRYPDTYPHYKFFMEWDNMAIANVGSYEEWYHALSKSTKKRIKHAYNSGLIVRRVIPNENFWKGVVEIYNETPIRQGRPFRHFGKDLVAVKEKYKNWDNPKNTFIGAFLGNELVGFVHIIDTDKYTMFSQNISKMKYWEKAPTNAMIAETVAICASKGSKYLVYAKMSGGTLGEFKRNNGFI